MLRLPMLASTRTIHNPMHFNLHLHHVLHHSHRHPNTNTRNSVIKKLCISGRIREAIQLLLKCSCPVIVNCQTYSLLLQEAMNRKDSLLLGRTIHAHIVITGFTPDNYLSTKLLIFHAKHGYLHSALHLFDTNSQSTLVPWNAIISGYATHPSGVQQQALNLYYAMRSAGLQPDHFTFSSVFRACAGLATLEHGKRAHSVLIKTVNPEMTNVVVNSALVDMYFKCSNPCDGRRVFEEASERNVVTWTALISGYGQHGNAQEVVGLFHRMISEGYRPNSVTYLALLSASSHGGLLDAGWKYFYSMTKDYGIRPKGEHYAAMVDMLGRAGHLEEAYDFVRRSPCKQHSVVWGALLGACRIHGDGELGKLAANKLFETQPANIGKHIVLSNTYAALSMWDEVADVRQRMGALGIKKEPASSSIEVRGHLQTFLVGDKAHEECELIYETLTALSHTIMESGEGLW